MGVVDNKGPASAFESPTFGGDASFHLDKPVGSASISPCGRDIVLASRQGLHIIDLDSPWSPPRHLSHYTPWEVADVQWSPFAARDYWVVSTSNQKALVWNLAMIDPGASIEYRLHAHSRAITDINFSAHHPDVLATCAVDSYVHCWDLRSPLRPAISFCDWFAGATQVKWNRQDSHILASSHDKFLRIWDDRKGAFPLRSIEAHATKIYGVDWNRSETNTLATCSLDQTIKLWDYTSESKVAERIINTPFPVWRARYTPFGSGLLAMPQRGNNDLHLFDRRPKKASEQPSEMPIVHHFEGHNGQVKEFLWRPRGSVQNSIDDREFQLVSWGADRVLRLHCLDDDILGKVGYVRGQEVKRTIPFTRKNAPYKSFREYHTHGEENWPLEPKRTIGIRGPVELDMNNGSNSLGGGWVVSGLPSISTAGKKITKSKDGDAISWMRGVKIGKRDAIPPLMPGSLPTVPSPNPKTDRIWDTFDSLADEITHVADLFGKVTFEEINMQSRYVVISLSGPWGPSKASIYTKCRIEIPNDYPTDEPAVASLDRTVALDEEVAFKITDDLHTIANAYQQRQRHSLEAMLRYLLGEQTCEESLTLLKAWPDGAVTEMYQQAESSSSDEDDDDNNGKLIDSQGRGLGSSDGMLAVSNAQYNVPLPKNCGAFWADNGRLVCFFPPKEPRVPSLLGTLNLKAGEKRAHKNIFENFGRLHSGSPVANKNSSVLSTIESGDSDFDDSSLSSNSSSFSGGTGLPRLNLMPSIVWRVGTRDQQHAMSIDDSSGLNGRTKSALQASRNFVSIHDLADLLPAKYYLAQDYCFGNNENCCIRNAEVARRYGHHELADVWSFLDLILRDEIPLDRGLESHKEEPISLIARRVSNPLKAKDSAIDLSYDSVEEDHQATVRGRIKRTPHPFGKYWLIDALFEYFEQQADVQMLAMLAHTLGGHLSNLERYSPSLEVAKSQLNPPASNPAFKLDTRKELTGSHSASSSIGASTSDPLTTFSTGITPPQSFQPSHISSDYNDHPASMASSPERFKQPHRSSSNLASTFAAHLSRPFNFTNSASSSPPITYPRRRLSPATDHLSASPTHFSFSATGFLGMSSAAIEDRNSAYPTLVPDGKDGTSQKAQVFQTVLKNQDQFDNDGYSSSPFLDSERQERYAAYQSSYANVLNSWQIPIAACEMLNYHFISDSKSRLPNPLEQSFWKDAIGMPNSGASISNVDADAADPCLSVEDKCLQCGDVVASRPKSRRCAWCMTDREPITCLFCASIIHGLSSPCLNCGHVLHASCRSAWHDSSENPYENECLSGCGCRCLDHLKVELSATAEVQHPSSPLVEPLPLSRTYWSRMIGSLAGTEDGELADDDAWEDVAYESLARNLGGRFLTPRPSQIWRGGGGEEGEEGEERWRSLREDFR